MDFIEYLFNMYMGIMNSNDPELKAIYYMEFMAGIKLLAPIEEGQLRRRIFKYKGWFV